MYWIVVVVAILVLLDIVIRELRNRPAKKIAEVIPQQPIYINLKPLEEAIQQIPFKVLQSITSSANTHQGKLAELVAFVELKAQYDRVIPLGNIADFLLIDFGREGRPGRIVFLDVKSGEYARLSTEQKQLQKLIEEKRIEFIKLKIEAE